MGAFKKLFGKVDDVPTAENSENVFYDWDHHSIVNYIDHMDCGAYTSSGRYPELDQEKFKEVKKKIKQLADEADLTPAAVELLLKLVVYRAKELELISLRETRLTRWRDNLKYRADKEAAQRQMEALLKAEEEELRCFDAEKNRLLQLL